ncbi:MAG: type II toxin-antitoxin system VapC family toxin [Gammaproteobacteria bacterium]|nr:type II toxin-antitoxin system VapC family toxin [Gammaproteobacteria bacterium]MCY4274641.1 type II toxin-antitoxin system VapC family toxin [Gammaproteobacteria bacterium]
MRFVVDASVAVKLLVEEPDSDTARELVESGQELHAPRLMVSEVANSLWRKARLCQIEGALTSVAIAVLSDMPIRWNDDETVVADAVRLALAFDHPVYDCIYLALAHRIGAVMLTADIRFANVITASEHGASILTLTDYAETR